MGRIVARLPETLWLRPILQVHDEIVFEIPNDKIDEAVKIVKQCMEEKPFDAFDVPIIAEASIGKSYGSMQELDG
jgi:DNA polymerase-1